MVGIVAVFLVTTCINGVETLVEEVLYISYTNPLHVAIDIQAIRTHTDTRGKGMVIMIPRFKFPCIIMNGVRRVEYLRAYLYF